jgi:sugar phosphate isomerase/epimerase
VTNTRQFGVSTHLYHEQRLNRDHLLEIASFGFNSVEVFATRTHVDYHNPAAIGDLQQWLAAAGLTLHSVHAPIAESLIGTKWGAAFSLASADADARARAVEEAAAAIHIARRIPYRFLVAHLGLPRMQGPAPGDNNREAARRSIDELQRVAEPLGVRVAVEVIPNDLSQPGTLVHFVEDVLEAEGVGICLDFGHAHIDGEVVDAIETVAEHLVTTHVHDNRGQRDEHLVPFDGTIDWSAAMTGMLKVGYEGTLLLEIAAQGSARDTLSRARTARQRIERMLAE